jgi:hypothetical protein
MANAVVPQLPAPVLQQPAPLPGPAPQPVPGNTLIPPVTQSTPGVSGFQQGDTLVAEESHLAFAIVDLQSKGINENNLEVFMIKVELNGGKQQTFKCESRNLKTALKMVEVFSRQFNQHSNDTAAYDRFHNSKVGKPVYMNFDKQGEKGHTSNRYTCLEDNGDFFEYAFGANSVAEIDELVHRDIKRLAKDHLTAPDDPVNRNDNDLVLQASLV